METVATVIHKHHDEIVRLWSEKASRCASARGLTMPVFQNLIPDFLSALASAGDELGSLTGRRRELIERHLSIRIREGFDLTEIIEEIALLGRVVPLMWEMKPAEHRPDDEQIELFFKELHAASTAVSDMFRKHMTEEEQTEKRYARLVEQVATEALAKDAQPFKQRLKEVLELIMDAMDAQAATVLLFDPDGLMQTTVVSAGVAYGALEEFVTTLDSSSFAGQVAAHEGPTVVVNALTTELHVDDVLKRNGIHSLLGVRLRSRCNLRGVLCIGLSASRSFSSGELFRIETLADRLTLHLDNARLHADLEQKSRDLQEKVAALTTERELRERFMSILAHDLRGPLNVAKMGSVILVHHPEKLDERRELAAKIDANIDRAERMIRDLLDTNRIRANEALPLHLDECDLGEIARVVVEELVTIYGERFVLEEEAGVRGMWDAEQLRRALWNLAINAVKYGSADRPVTISVKASNLEVQMSVHNYGSVIAPEDQAHLFDAFARTRQAQTGGQIGWGLGLTLVRGCAEAHGGRISVHSSAASGTTFTLHLPPDSRSYQAGDKSAA